MEFMRFSGYTRVDVEPNDNTPMMAQQVYKNLGVAFPVSHVRVYEGEPDGQLCAITGWSSQDGGTPAAAFAVQIEDSSAGSAYLVYGGDYGVRLKPAESDAAWDTSSPNQWGDSAPVEVPSLGLTVHVSVQEVEVVPEDTRLAVEPDVPVALTAADFFAGRDPVLARALR